MLLAEDRLDFSREKSLQAIDGRLLFFGSDDVSHVVLL
jgi:hypothetical protein